MVRPGRRVRAGKSATQQVLGAAVAQVDVEIVGLLLQVGTAHRGLALVDDLQVKVLTHLDFGISTLDAQ